jgi:hypothetical protein
MPIDQNGVWYPSVSKRQAELLAESSHLIVDVEGPRKSSKTVGACHRLARHLWECPNARAAMAGRTLTDNFDGGTWQLMCEQIIPEWIESGIGMKWHKEPKISQLTHKMECAVTNAHGGVSRLQLDSLKNEREVERIYKGRMYSAIYMTEAANFKRRASFEIMLQCLRGFGEDWKNHFIFLIDTNPAEEGQSHWIYQLFHVFRRMTRKEIEEAFPHTVEAMIALRDKLAIYRFAVADNIWMSESDKQELEAQFMLSGADVYARHWLGEWKSSAADSAFARVWRPEIHVCGDMATVADPNPAILIPPGDCVTLYTGWDLGDIHNAIVIAEKTMEGKPNEEQPVFKIIDELVMIDTPIKLEDLTLEFMDLMRWWEEEIGHPVKWVHWADSSAMSGFQSISASNEAKEVFRASDQAIELVGVTKGPNSVVKRLQLTRRLLFANRLFISARCEQLIQTMTMLKTNAQGSLKRTGDPLRHAFDAMSYLIAMEAWSELVLDIEHRLAKPGNPIIHT